MSFVFWAGLLALAITAALWAYLRMRVRQLNGGVARIEEFRSLAGTLATCGIPTDKITLLRELNEVVGTGRVARFLLRRLMNGDFRVPKVDRNMVEASRRDWAGVSREHRIAFVRAVFCALIADSFFAGWAGVAFRRIFFFVQTDPAAIAEAVDAYETRVLIMGTQRATSRIEKPNHRHDKECVPA